MSTTGRFRCATASPDLSRYRPRGIVLRPSQLVSYEGFRFDYANLIAGDQNSIVRCAALKRAGCQTKFEDEVLDAYVHTLLFAVA
jgi:hypothetical protein